VSRVLYEKKMQTKQDAKRPGSDKGDEAIAE
jgi:hypothetical protein